MIAVTGLGAVSGFGDGVPALCEGVWSGATAIGRRPFPEAGPAAVLAGGPHLGTDLGLRVAREALADAPLDRAHLGLVVGSTAGDMVLGEAAYLATCDGAAPDDDFVWAQRCDRPAHAVARALGLGGPRLTVSNACSSGVAAIGIALDWLDEGRVDAALVLGVDALCRLTAYGFGSLGLVSERPCRPFDRARDGISLGDGAAALLLERAGERPEATPLAYVRGYGNAQDAWHMTAPHPEAAGLQAAIEAALGDLDASEVGYVNAHGTGTKLNDASEGALYQRMLPGAAVSSTKGATGHTLGAAGTLEALITVVALHRGVLPPNAGLDDPELELDLVREARPASVRHALSVSAAFGGNCTAVRLEAP